MRIDLPASVIAAFEAEQAIRGRDATELEHDAFMTFGGMGPCRYITRDGRFLVGADEFWHEPVLRESKDEEAIATLRGAGRRFSSQSLLDLIPIRPPDALACSSCDATGWLVGQHSVICPKCSGLGWERPVPANTSLERTREG